MYIFVGIGGWKKINKQLLILLFIHIVQHVFVLQNITYARTINAGVPPNVDINIFRPLNLFASVRPKKNLIPQTGLEPGPISSKAMLLTMTLRSYTY